MSERKPTVLQINVTANWGSTGKIAEDIGKLAMANGWNSFIAYGRTARESSSILIPIGNSGDIKRHVIKSRVFDNQGLNSKGSTKWFIKKIEELKPDIIHLHNIHGYYLNYKLLFQHLAFANVPIVWTLHDCWPFTGHCGYFDYAECELWKTGCHAPCPCKKDYPKSLFFDRCQENWLLKKELFTSVNNLTLVPVSSWLAGLVEESFLGKYDVNVIHNGIDLNVFEPQSSRDAILKRYGLEGKKLVIGVASVWDKRKGLSDFLELRRILPDNFLIVLVGVNQEQIKMLPDGVVGIKRTQNQNELAKLYSASDVYVNTSYEDNYPTTNLESMACGTPVITYNTGGSPEAVTDNTGLVLKKGDLKALSNAIQIIVSRGKEMYSKYCRERAVSSFDKDVCFKEYMRLYDEILLNAR